LCGEPVDSGRGATRASSALLGALLVRAGVISVDQLEQVLAEQEQRGRRLGDLLRERNWVTSRDLALALAEQWGLEFVDLAGQERSLALVDSLPADVARQYGAVPVRFDEEGSLVVALADPSQAASVSALRAAVRVKLRFAVADEASLEPALERLYG
jgi:type IV pilus assembly protein PilB